jgi:hypothetical protein
MTRRCLVPSLFRQNAKTNENQPSMVNVELTANPTCFEQVP